MRFVDTNIFIRFLVRDDEKKAQACFEFFQRLKAGDEQATTSEAVICEVVYVLSSPRTYKLSHDEVRARLTPLLSLPGLHLSGKRTYLRALDLYAQWQWADFEDALSTVYMEQQGIDEIVSYDTGFDRVEGITRVEP